MNGVASLAEFSSGPTQKHLRQRKPQTGSRPRGPTLAASYAGQHVVGGAELQAAYLAGLEGEVEGDLYLSAVDPGGARAIFDEDREGSRGSAVEEGPS